MTVSEGYLNQDSPRMAGRLRRRAQLTGADGPFAQGRDRGRIRVNGPVDQVPLAALGGLA